MSISINNNLSSSYNYYNTKSTDNTTKQPAKTFIEPKPGNKPQKGSHKGLFYTLGAIALSIIGAIVLKGGKGLKLTLKNILGHKKTPNIDVITPPTLPTTPTVNKLEMTSEAKETYNKIYALLHPKKKSTINAQTIDESLSPKQSQKKVWDTQDMNQYYKELEKDSNKIITLEQTLAKNRTELIESLEGKSIAELYQIRSNSSQKYREFLKSIEKDTGKKPHTPEQKLRRKYERKLNLNNQDRSGLNRILEEHEKTKSYTPEQKLKEKYYKEEEKIISDKIKQVQDNIYAKVQRPGDRTVRVNQLETYANPDEMRAFYSYYDNYSYNSALRAGEDITGISEIKLMDSALQKAPAIQEDCVVYRGLHGHPVIESMNKFIDSIKEGVIIKDPSYISTSIDTINDQFRYFTSNAMEGNGIIMRIKLPKGTKGVLGGFKEFVLPRNSSIKINKIETVNGVKIADAEYILP